jgi:integrase
VPGSSSKSLGYGLACNNLKSADTTGDSLDRSPTIPGRDSNAQSAPPCDMVPVEANSGRPSKGDAETMARRRFQDPKPKKKGNWWYLLYWQDEFVSGVRTRKRARKKLALATMPEREVRKIAAEFLRPLNQGLITIGSATKFRDYVASVYWPTVLPLMAMSTQKRYRGVIKNYLLPAFGDLCLRDLTSLALQRYFSEMAGVKLAHESQDKIRDVLSGILGSAVKYGYLVKNPAEGLTLPPSKKGKRVKPFLTPQQFMALVSLIPEPYATMVFVAVHTGLRVSELIGLKWRNVCSDSITIEERCCRGDWGAPKSEASNATIPVNRAVVARLHRLKSVTVELRAGNAIRRYPAVKSSKPDDLVFQSIIKGRPMRDNNILSRFIKPAARTLGIAWVNWRCLRTSHATWLKLAGADVKDAQAQMRHSRASTTLDIYQQFIPESQRRVIEKLGELTEPRRVQ